MIGRRAVLGVRARWGFDFNEIYSSTNLGLADSMFSWITQGICLVLAFLIMFLCFLPFDAFFLFFCFF